MSDTPESVRAMAKGVGYVPSHIRRAIEDSKNQTGWIAGFPNITVKRQEVETLIARLEAIAPVLERYADLLERSAGVWVSTKERLPEPYLTVYFHGGVGYWAHNIWYSQTLTEWPRPVSYHVTHWLDVRLPGGK